MVEYTREPKPSNGLLVQKTLNPDPPDNWDEKSKSHVFEIDFDTVTKNKKTSLVFKYKFSPNGDNAQGLSFEIPENCYIIIKLASDKQWRWSNIYQAITTKINRDYLYYHLQYSSDGQSWYNWTNGITGDHKFIRIKAMKLKTINPGKVEIHGFSFNIELLIPKIDGDDQYWLPITIDPDIINPKDPRFNVVEGRNFGDFLKAF